MNCLWFDGDAEDAARFYVSVFKGRMLAVTRFGESASKVSGMKKGTVMTAVFRLGRQDFMALNGGPEYKFTPAISFMVNCRDQKEIDYYWAKLTKGGKVVQCGWLTDKFGVSWQIVPEVLGKLVQGRNSEKVLSAMLKMKKLDIAKLKQAAK